MESLTNGTPGTPAQVRAKYKFEGKNNDELCFRKNDVITLTQKPEGGWWEGTLNGKTGWFPSNYVAPIHLRSKSPGLMNPQMTAVPPNKPLYRNYVLNGLIESERKHVSDLQSLYSQILHPILAENKLTTDEYAQLTGNLDQILTHQENLLSFLEESVKKAPMEQRVGGEFMRSAPLLKSLLKSYCENHPLAVHIINQRKIELTAVLESHGMGLQNVVSGLSLAFRRVDRYPSILQELERNMEESHPDRGDTQRAAAFYRTLATFCMQTRKQKEMQIDFLATASIENWQGPKMETLGSIVFMGTASVVNACDPVEERVDRCLIIFPSSMLILQVAHKINAFLFIDSLNLTNSVVNKLEGDRLKIEGSSPGKQLEGLQLTCDAKPPIQLLFTSAEQLNLWWDALQNCDVSSINIQPTTPTKYDTVKTNLSPSVRPQVCTLPPPNHAEYSSSLPYSRPYSGYSIRPIASTCLTSYANNVHMRNGGVSYGNDEDDASVLRIIESYCCTSTKRGSVDVQVLVPEDEKLIIEDIVDGQLVIHEKSLVDTVYALREQMINIQQEVKNVNRELEKEKKARRRLEGQIAPENTQS